MYNRYVVEGALFNSLTTFEFTLHQCTMSQNVKIVYFEHTRILHLLGVYPVSDVGSVLYNWLVFLKGKLEELLILLIFKDKPKPTCLPLKEISPKHSYTNY
jgi:hypothetical protein